MNLILNDSIIKALSWTLIHSLWIGLAAAILAGLTLLLTKKSNFGNPIQFTCWTEHLVFSGSRPCFLQRITNRNNRFTRRKNDGKR